MENRNASGSQAASASRHQQDRQHLAAESLKMDHQTTDKAHTEGEVAKAIERETTKLPSDIFLWSGLGLLAAAVVLHSMKQRHAGLLVGQFAAPILIMGLYNKTVKQSGHDYVDTEPS